MSPGERMRVAAIDIGSNSIRLLVADVEPGPGEVSELLTVARAGEACRLGRGLGEHGRIDAEMAERAASIAAEFARRARQLGALHTVAAATAAVRSAANGTEVSEHIARRCGLPVRVLSGDEEARMVYGSVVQGLGSRIRRSQCIVFDLGGGSTEVVSGVGEQPGRWASLAFGVVSLTERFLRSDPPRPDEIAALEEFVREHLMHECALMPADATLMAGVGGTVTVLASLDRGLTAYDPVQLEGWMIPRERLGSLLDRVVHAGQSERRGWPIMGEGRADIIGAGALVVGMLVARFRAAGLMCSTQGLRYGLARLAAREAGAGIRTGSLGIGGPEPGDPESGNDQILR